MSSLHVKNKASHNATNKNSSQVSQMKQNTTFGDQINTVNGTAELNYNQTNHSQVVGQNVSQQVTGPQLTFDKNYLCMKSDVGKVEQDKVVVSNVGTTTVTYDWHKVNRPDYIQSKNSDGIQRFYCHYPRGILKPGESKTFIFSFRSDTKPGMFFEEWELLTEPQLLTLLPLINLSGIAIMKDDLIQSRKQTIEGREAQVQNKLIDEILQQDILDKVESPPSPPPNLQDPEVFKQYFEDNNKHLGLYYTPSIMTQLFDLIQDIQSRINDGQDYMTPWRGKMEYIEDLIQAVPNKYSRETLKERYVALLSQARKVPIDRAQSYSVFRKMLLDLSENTIELEAKGREDLQMMESFGFTVPHENQTEEEVKKLLEEQKARKADWLKKTKKKPKTEEEDQAELEELKNRIQNGLKTEMLTNKVEKAESDIEYEKTKWLFENHLKMNEDQYDELHRLESILDIDISGKDLVMRLDLDVPLSPYVPPQPPSQHQTLEDHNKSQINTRLKKTQQQQQQEALLQQQLLASQQEDPWKKRDILDHTLIKKATNDIRYAIEHLANRTFIIGNLGERHGKIKPENSMRIVFNVLQQQLIEQQMIFLPDAIIKDFEKRKENEEFPESTTFMLENLNFKPDEFGYVEPEKPPEEPKPTDEELKREEELKQQAALAAQQKPGAKGGAQKPADKKKAEEEAKKKAEEEAAALALQRKKEQEKAISEEERLEQQRIKEEAERKKREMEYFDYKTIHKYKENLGRYGDIYVNDAPVMSLTASNSVAEIKCKRRVMGLRMTEEIRKLTLFFMKKNPKDINHRWYTKPIEMEYHQNNLSIYIGGVIKNGIELLDKVLMINSLLDTATQIHLFGEVALAAFYALGLPVGRVERTNEQIKDYEKCKDFFLQMFKKAIIYKNVKFIFPVDFIVSQKLELEDSMMLQQQDQQNMSNNNGGMGTQDNVHNQSQISQKMMGDKTNNQSKQNISQNNIDDYNNTKNSQGGIPPHLQESPKWRPYHWADKIIHHQKHRYVNMQRQLAEKWNALCEEYWPEYIEFNNIDTQGYYTHLNYPQYSIKLLPQQPEDNDEPQTEQIQPDEYILEYGDVTRQQIFSNLEQSFKLFWDGSLSFFKDAVLASETNKQFVQKLLDFRIRTQNDDEPPVTLLHGQETEQVLRHSLMRIKVEIQEAQEAAKRKAQLEGEELEEEEDQITMTNEESREEASTLQQDISQIADFFCFDVPQFTTKIIQGVPIKALYNLDQHPKKTKEQEEEDLFLLDEI